MGVDRNPCGGGTLSKAHVNGWLMVSPNRVLWVAAAAAVISIGASDLAFGQTRAFQFAAIGDTGYSRKSEQEFERMLAAMNKENLEFVVHVGDFEADPRPYERSPDRISMPCTDESFERVLASFQTSVHPFVLTPGDNDWADCHLLKARKVDPLERLEKVRAMFFPAGRSLGRKTIAVQSQAKEAGFAKFRENLTWSLHGVTFATFHIVGSNDNKGRTPDADAEQAERAAANLAWLKQTFAAAKAANAAGLVLITQANPGFESRWTASLQGRYVRVVPGVDLPKQAGTTPFDGFLDALAAEMDTYDKPTLFIHGDTHLYRINKPLLSQKTKRFFEHFTRLEVFGDPDTHWVRVTVDPAKAGLFVIEPEIVAGNRAN
jgi:predicted phosphodiesterase